MELISYFFCNAVDFQVASIPLVTVFVQLKKFKMSPKQVSFSLLLQLIVKIYFWVKMKDVYIVLYQSLPFLFGFICLYAENLLIKRSNKKDATNNSIPK